MTDKFNILVVDDEPDLELLMRQKFRKQLATNKIDFVFAPNGVEALKILKKDKSIKMVISDINMPEMDGLTLLNKINEQFANLLSVIISAYGDMDNIRQAMNLGAFDFVTKPIDFKDLGITIDRSIEHMETLETAESTKKRLERLQQELSIANDIQQSILPKKFVKTSKIELHASMQPAREVGGDFYDFFWLDADHLGFVMADVSGKGVPAALFMTVSRTLIRAHAYTRGTPGHCLRHVSELLAEENDNLMFVTAFYGILNIKTGELSYANGGHLSPYVVKKNGDINELELTDGIALGLLNEFFYPEKSLVLDDQDVLFLFTDGVTEAIDHEQQEFGQKRLRDVLKANCSHGVEELVHKVKETLDNFVDESEHADDITMMALKFNRS